MGLGPGETAFEGADENSAGVEGPEQAGSKVAFLRHIGFGGIGWYPLQGIITNMIPLHPTPIIITQWRFANATFK